MRAAQISMYGDQDVVEYTESATRPKVGEGQVLVEVRAAGVNPFDYKIREGQARQMAELAFPATLGGDVAGVIVELGSGVTNLVVGAAVYGQAGALSGEGSFAEFTPVKATQLAHKPASVDFQTAAALPLVSVSAYQALVDHIGLQTGQKLLIHGAAGGIGSMAVQLAKHFGAYVTATAAKTDEAFVKDLGADEVIDYQSQDFAALLSGYDAVFDTVGAEVTAKSYTILKPGGALVSMVAPADESLVERYKVRFTHEFTHVTTERLTKIAELVDQGVLKVRIDKTFSLEQAAEALEYLRSGHPHGKVVITVSES